MHALQSRLLSLCADTTTMTHVPQLAFLAIEQYQQVPSMEQHMFTSSPSQLNPCCAALNADGNDVGVDEVGMDDEDFIMNQFLSSTGASCSEPSDFCGHNSALSCHVSGHAPRKLHDQPWADIHDRDTAGNADVCGNSFASGEAHAQAPSIASSDGTASSVFAGLPDITSGDSLACVLVPPPPQEAHA